ncbi:MAG: L,D-transpeptidase family protein [Candidatus Desulforudaceae bacterium]|nr:L,D-transpeptidase family protein [Eubacteriales bacterium]
MRRVVLLTKGRILGIAALCLLGLTGLVLSLWVPYEVEYTGEESVVRISFLVPMQKSNTEQKLRVIPENPRVEPQVDINWCGSSTMVLRIRENEELEGQRIRVRLTGARTLISALTKSVNIVVQRPVEPELRDLTPTVASRGSVVLRFNTPLDPSTVPGNIVLMHNGVPVAGRWEPSGADGQSRTVDTSVWLFEPRHSLPHDETYAVVVKTAVASQTGVRPKSEIRGNVRSAPALAMLSLKPTDKAKEVDLHPEITVEYNQPLLRAEVRVESVRGKTDVWANQVQFTPLEVLIPGETYKVKIRATSRHGEEVTTAFQFTTRDVQNRMWVAVDLEGTHNVTVYKGREPYKTFKASGGKVTSPTPLGTYYVYNRGYCFYNARLHEGAYYWVQFSGPFLFHSIPFDTSGKIKDQEAEKLGQPASHGCVRLSLEDARWFYENVPNGTMIVIYNKH